jgi:hypothetical protein
MVDATHQIEQKRDEEHLEHLLAPLRSDYHSCLRHGRTIEAGACYLAIGKVAGCESGCALFAQVVVLLLLFERRGMPQEVDICRL